MCCYLCLLVVGCVVLSLGLCSLLVVGCWLFVYCCLSLCAVVVGRCVLFAGC